MAVVAGRSTRSLDTRQHAVALIHTVEVLLIIAIGSIVGGLALGLAVFLYAPTDVRAKVKGQCLRFGSGGALFLVVWAFVATGQALPQVEIAIGLIVGIALVAGVALSVAGRGKSGV
jgi:hypothetical protein